MEQWPNLWILWHAALWNTASVGSAAHLSILWLQFMDRAGSEAGSNAVDIFH